ncbi:MAG: hypothetical protein WD673_12925 [Alphaproteobacteria bacterium]
MTAKRSGLAIVGLVAALSLVAPARAEAADLALARVLLSTGGVGYFEYRAEVSGDAVLPLEVPLDQVDDVLKSIVVFDAAGSVGTVELPGREPILHAFRDFPFGPEALDSPAALLATLKGAQVRLTGDRLLEGRVLAVVPETVALPDGTGVIQRHRVTLMGTSGIVQTLLEDVQEIAFVDPTLGAQVEAALEALARHRVQDRRTLEIAVKGEGTRTVTVGYVVAVPLWKASYRVTLPIEGEDKGLVQGWAHVENLSGRDWEGVELTLVSGNPVTFRQALYEAYFVDRPEIPVEVVGRVLPSLDQGAVALAKTIGGELRRAESDADDIGQLADLSYAAEETAPAAPAEPPASADLFRADAQVAGAEAATHVVFTVADPVTVEDGDTIMVPIVQAAIPMARVAVYQPATHARHPVASVRLANAGEAGLPPGVATLYERDGQGEAVFVGDARMPGLPPGEERLLAYALDQKTIVDREDGYTQEIGRIKAHDGIFEIERIERQTTSYRVEAPAREARAMIIEQPRIPGWDLVEPKGAAVELAEATYRIPVDVAAGTELGFDVVLEHTLWEEIGIIDLATVDLVAIVSEAEVDKDARKALEGLVGLRERVEALRNRIARLDLARTRLFDDQTRIRDNLYRVPTDSDIAHQYLAKLAEQEGEIESVEKDYLAVADALAEAEGALAAAIGGLDID